NESTGESSTEPYRCSAEFRDLCRPLVLSGYSLLRDSSKILREYWRPDLSNSDRRSFVAGLQVRFPLLSGADFGRSGCLPGRRHVARPGFDFRVRLSKSERAPSRE